MGEYIQPLIQVHPPSVNFMNFQPGQILQRDFYITNVTMQDQRVYCSFPSTKFFSVNYHKEHYLSPGLSLKVSVSFKPEESCFYSDFVRVLCKQNPEVIVHIQGFPSTPIITFPSVLEFPVTPVGQSCSLSCALSCISPVDLKFSLQLRPQDISFIVEPSSGILSSTGQTTQMVITYQPKVRAEVKLDLLLRIEELDIPARSCRIIAGTSGKKKKDKLPEELSKDTRHSDTSKSPQRSKHKATSTEKKSPKHRRSDIQISPAEMESLFHSIDISVSKSSDSSKTPLQKSKKLKQTKDSFPTTSQTQKKDQRLVKEANFLNELRTLLQEEKKVETSCCVRVGSDPLTTEERANIVMKRQLERDKLRMKEEMDLRNKQPVLIKRRTIRDLTAEPPVYDWIETEKYINNPWPIRVRNLNRIKQAIRKTIVRIRMTRRLQTIQEWLRMRQYKEARVTDISAEDIQYLERMPFTVKVEKINHTSQTIFWREEYEDILPKYLEKEHFFPLPFLIEWIPTPVSMQYPEEYRLLGYKPLNVQEFRNTYVQTAKSEITEQKCLYENLVQKLSVKEKFPVKKVIEEKIEALLVPPESLFFPMDKNAISLFNPKPGVQTMMPLHLTTEMDSDFCLYPLSDTGGTHLDSQEIVAGALVTKHFAFPSESFLNRNASPTLPSSLHPRWKSNFSTEILPREGPSLFQGSALEDIKQTEDIKIADLETRIRPILTKLSSFDRFLKTPERSEKSEASSSSKTSSSK